MKEYLDIIYNYYPKDIDASDLRYPYTVENIRYFEMQEDARINNKDFNELIEDLTNRYNYFIMDQSLYGVFDPVYRAKFRIPEQYQITDYSVSIIMVSVISDFYVIYLTQSYADGKNSLLTGPGKENEHNFIDEMKRMIKYYFPNHKPFPMKYYNEIVPGVSSGNRPFENATYFECLITNFIQ